MQVLTVLTALLTLARPMLVLAPKAKFWLASAALGLVGSLISIAVFNLIYRDYPLVPGFLTLIAGVLIAAITLSLLNAQQVWLDKRLPWTTGIARRFVIQLGLAASSMLVPALAIVSFFMGSMVAGARSFLRTQDLAIVTGVSATLVALTVLLNLGVFLMHKWRESSLEAERYRKENVEFRFEMLRNQVNPHFLFNSLNTLAGLVYSDPAIASNFVRELARVYRYVLETGDRELTPLDKELTFLDAFIYLVKIRFAEGLDITVQASDEARKGQLPPLSLQLLVENAIKHNVVSASKPLQIRIVADAFTVTVSNNLQRKIVPEAGTHTGLSNIRNRYSYLTDQKIAIEETYDTFSICLPLLKPDDHV